MAKQKNRNDARPSHEQYQEALAAYTKFFRKKVDSLNARNPHEWAKFISDGHFRRLQCGGTERAASEKIIDGLINSAHFGDEFATMLLCRLVINFIEADKPLRPARLKEWVQWRLITPHLQLVDVNGEVMVGPIKRKPGKGENNQLTRRMYIWGVMSSLVEYWGFPATRNESKRGSAEDPSAAWIVSEALRLGANIQLSEAGVVKIWNETRRHVRETTLFL